MKRQWLQRLTKSRHTLELALLLAPVLFAVLVLMPSASLGQANGTSEVAVPTLAPAKSEVLSAPKVSPLSAPNGARHPWFRLVAVLCSGLFISAARLARKFRLFWGLGVFSNPWAFVFLIFGAALCAFPVALQSVLQSTPFMRNLDPWIGAVSGIALAFTLPAIPLKPKPSPASEGQVRGLEDPTRSNVFMSVIEDAIRERILLRMQKEVLAACDRYDWNTIKLAAGRALEEEMTVRPLRQDRYDAYRQNIENFHADPDARLDSNNKYLALVALLRWCSFYRLRDSLDVAVREVES